MDEIKKTVNMINSKVTDIETKMKGMETRLTANEDACAFISSVNEENKEEIKDVKKDVSETKKSYEQLVKETQELKETLGDTQSRLMRDNLLFYGFPEGGQDENCEEKAKALCKETLKIATADQMLFTRAHRIGNKSSMKVRPLVVKFHYYHERELVRQRSFEYSDPLKAVNIGIGAQLPKIIRDARKPLYPAMNKAKTEGKNVKFVGTKLFIEGKEFVQAATGPGPQPMTH